MTLSEKKPRFCQVVGHGGSARSTPSGEIPNLWTCNRYGCGGIQAWRAHEQEDERDRKRRFRDAVVAEEHRWQRHFGLKLTPVP